MDNLLLLRDCPGTLIELVQKTGVNCGHGVKCLFMYLATPSAVLCLICSRNRWNSNGWSGSAGGGRSPDSILGLLATCEKLVMICTSFSGNVGFDIGEDGNVGDPSFGGGAGALSLLELSGSNWLRMRWSEASRWWLGVEDFGGGEGGADCCPSSSSIYATGLATR